MLLSLVSQPMASLNSHPLHSGYLGYPQELVMAVEMGSLTEAGQGSK